MTLRVASEWKEAERLLNGCLCAYFASNIAGRITTSWGIGMIMPVVDSHDNPNPVYSLFASIIPSELIHTKVGDPSVNDFPLYSGHFAAFQTGDDYTRVQPIKAGFDSICWDDMNIDWLFRTRPRIFILRET